MIVRKDKSLLHQNRHHHQIHEENSPYPKGHCHS